MFLRQSILSRKLSPQVSRLLNAATNERRHRPSRRSLRIEPLEARALLTIDFTGLPSWLDIGSKPMLSAGSVSDPGNPASGAVEDLAIDPSDPSHMFAGTVNGGIWETNNGDRPFNGIDDDGVNGVDDPLEQPDWFPRTDQFSSLGINGINFDPLDPTGNTVFAGTGSASSLSNTGGLPIGIMRTTDGGTTWSVFPLNPGGSEPQVRAVVPTTFDDDPGAAGMQQVVLVGTVSSSMGLFRSTDGGQTYTVISGTNGLPTGPVTEVIADPNDSSVYYAGVVGDGVFRSDDGGENWVDVNNADLTNAALGSSTAVMLAAHPGGGTTRVYAMISYDDPDTANPPAVVPQVFTTTDDGASWTELAAVTAGFESGNGDLYIDMASDQIIVDASDEEIVYLAKGYGGGLFLLRYDPAGGGSWVNIEDPGAGGTRPHVDSRDFQFVQSGGNDVLIHANDGGLYFLADPQNNASTWVSLHGRGANGLGLAEYTNVAWDSTFNVAIGGAQDNGTSAENGFLDPLWTSFRGSDGGDVQVDTVNAGAGQVFRYTSTQNFGLTRHTFNSATNEVTSLGLVPVGGLPGYSNFFVPAYELNAVDPVRLVTGGSGANPVYELLNAGTTPDLASVNWQAVPIGAGFGSVNDVDGAAFAYGGRLGGVDNPEVLVVGSGGNVFVRSTAGGTLTATPTAFPGDTVQDIVLDPENWQHFFAADDSGVWETTDAGTTWTDLTANLASVNTRLQSLEFVPTPDGGAVVVGGNQGVSKLLLGGGSGQWVRFGAGLPNTLVNDLDYNPADDVLLAGAFGRGAWLMLAASVVIDEPGVLTICGDEDFTNEDDVIRLVRNDANPLLLDVYLNSVVPVFSTVLALVEQINVFGQGGNDNLIVDSSFGLITVPDGIRYDGDGICFDFFQEGGDFHGVDRGFDTLTLVQDSDVVQDSDQLAVGQLPGSGISTIVGDDGTQVVYFEELEPVLDTVPATLFNVTSVPGLASLLDMNNVIDYGPGQLLGAAAGRITIDNFEPIEFSNKTNLTLDAGAGSDVISLNNPSWPTGLTTIQVNADGPANTFSGNDRVILLAVPATTTGFTGPVTVNGGPGDDVVDGSAITAANAPSLVLNGDTGNDTLVGGIAADTIDGGAGDDVLAGGGGNNTFNGGTGFDTVLVQGTLGNDRINVNQSAAATLAVTVNSVLQTNTLVLSAGVRTVEAVRVEGLAGDDVIQVSWADGLGVDANVNSLRMDVVGGPAATRDRLAVVDSGIGDLVLYRKGESDSDGSITVGPGNAEPLEMTFEGMEFIQPIAAADGAVVVFKHDPLEFNDELALATHLGANDAINVDPTIEPGADAGFALPGDQDWYRVEAEVTGTLDFQVFFRQIATVASGRPGLPGNGDLSIEVYDVDGLVNGVPLAIAGNGTFGANDANDNERIRIPAVQGQVYFLRVVGALDAAVNNYSITTINAAPPVAFDLELADNLVILTGAQETPPVVTGANGTANFQYDAVANTFDLDLFVSGIELTDVTALPQLTGAHIHRAAVGVAGPVIGNLGIAGWTVEPAGIRLRLTGAAFSAAPADIAALLAGDTYINVHSTNFAAGEVRGQINIPNIAGVSDSGRSQFDDVTKDNTPTIFLRLDDAILLNDLPGNAAGTPDALPPDQVIPVLRNSSTAASPIGLAAGFRVAVYDETDTHNPVPLGFAQPVANLNGVYSFTFTTPLTEGSHFISARVQMIDPADNDVDPLTATPATGFGPRSLSLEIVVDTVPPPVVFGVASDATDGLADDPGVIPQLGTFVDTKTNDVTPTLWGTAEANAVVRVYADLTPNDGVDNLDVLLGMTVAVPLDGTNQYPNGQWTVTSTVNLNDPQYFPLDGLRRILVTAEDLAGNINPAPDVAAEALEIYLDTQGPQVFGVFFTRDPVLVGANGNTLYRFRASAPSTIIATVPVIGLAAGEKIEGIDLRPADGLLYALINGATDRLVTVDPFTGATTPVGNLGVVLSGSAFGVDFDPVTDELRVVSNFDQNLRVDPATGLAVADPVLNPGNPNVVSIAYTNNTVGTDTTGLYGIDTAADTLVLQNPADSGTLTTIGPLGVNATNLVGFDIMPELNVGYASIRVGVTTQLYQIDLATGAATLLGNVGSNPMLGGLTALAPYDVFDPKPSTDGPTPLVWEVTIRVQDLPARVLQYQNPAVNELVAEDPGLYLLTGDANGIIPIASVEFLPDPFVDGQPASGTIVLRFDKPLPDDRFSLWISDSLVDDVGNKLDGESNADEPHEQPLFASGDGQPGGEFLARFTVDSRPEIATYSAGSVYVDTNGNFGNDPANLDYTNRDLTYTLTSPIGFTNDNLFCGNFVTAAVGTADGFDKLAAYGRIGTQYRWLVDVNNDGVPDIVHDEPLNLNAVPFSGNFDGNLRNGSEVGLFAGNAWYFDTNHDFLIDAASKFTGQITGYPIVGDFDGDGRMDLGTYRDDRFFFQLGTLGGFSAVVQTLDWGFVGVRERPVAADMDQDGVTDIGLWVPDRTGTIATQTGEWYFLMSDDLDPTGDGLDLPDRSPGTLVTINHPFSPTPLGHDIFARFGNDFAMPLVGNFDPPVASEDLEPVGVDVSLVGTSGNDQMDFAPGATAGTWTVTINGVSQTFTGTSIKLKLDGRGGQDTVVLKGGAGLDQAVLRPGLATLTGVDYSVTAIAESSTIDAGGGPGKAVFYGAAGIQDTFTAQRGTALMTSPVTAGSSRLYSRQALGFTQVQAIGSADRQDVANLTDAAVRSLLTAENNWAKLSSLDAARPYAISAMDFGTVGVKLNHKMSRQQIASTVDFLLSVS